MSLRIAVAIILLAIAAIGAAAEYYYRRTQERLKRLHEDLQGGMKSLHDRADREGAERVWSLQGIRGAVESVRLQIVALFRRADD